MIPLMLDLRDKRIVIFGGGEVGARKATFFQHESEVEVFSRSFHPAFEDLDVKCHAMDASTATDAGIEEVLQGAFLVVSALDDRMLNDRIGLICRSMDIFFNNADGEQGTVIVPSVSRGEHYLIAISTLGKSPATAKYLREKCEQEWGALDRMIELQSRLRSRLKDTHASQQERKDILWKVLGDTELWQALVDDEQFAYDLAVRKYLS